MFEDIDYTNKHFSEILNAPNVGWCKEDSNNYYVWLEFPDNPYNEEIWIIDKSNLIVQGSHSYAVMPYVDEAKDVDINVLKTIIAS